MNTSANSPHSPQRLALDLQRARDELELERQRTHQLLDEIDRQNAELDRLRSSVHREPTAVCWPKRHWMNRERDCSWRWRPQAWPCGTGT